MALTICVLALGAVWPRLHGYRQRPQLAPTTLTRDLSMDFVRQPYLHHNPDGIRYGDEARLLHYAISADEVQAGEALTRLIIEGFRLNVQKAAQDGRQTS